MFKLKHISGGISTMLSEISFAVWFQFLYAAIYGLSIGNMLVFKFRQIRKTL